MGDYFVVDDQPEKKRILFIRIRNPANVPSSNLIWLDTDPPGVKQTDGFTFIASYGAALAPLVLLKNLNDQTLYSYEGDTQVFNVSVDGGKKPYTYKWRKRIDSTYTPVGNNTDSYSFNITSSAQGAYTCVITDADGKAITSKETSLMYAPALVFTQQPAGLAIMPGVAIMLTVNATGGYGSRKYQWYKNNVAINGATSNTYMKALPAASDAGIYYVKVTDSNPANPRTIQSQNAVLTA